LPREFRVAAGLRPGQIRISWADRAPGLTVPPFRLVRRRLGFPAAVTDGFTVVDTGDLFQAATTPPPPPWHRIERLPCVASNSVSDGGLLQGVLELYYVAAATNPSRTAVSVYDATTATLQRMVFDEVSRVITSSPASPPFTQVQAWEIFETPGGGAEVSRGVVTFLELASNDPPDPNRLRWTPAAGPVLEAEYDERRHEVTSSSDGGRRFETTLTGITPSRRLVISSETIAEAGLTEWTLAVDDGDLEPGVVYYYRVFGAGGVPLVEPDRGSALATGVYGAHDLMYRLLPPVYQIEDIDPTRVGGGRELYKFLAAFGLGVDHFRGQVDGIASRHDLAAARADLLPHLARMIGWLPDLTVSENMQRQDIRFAPELFGGLGTLRNAPALINRVTGWPSRVKEFVHNVLLTNAPEDVRIWEIWEITRGAGGWTTPAPFSLTTSMDGGPVAMEVAGTPWVTWHSDRSGRRELWYQRPGVDAEAGRVMDGAPDDGPNLEYSDEAPAGVEDGGDLRLFWTSTRGESPDIWTRLVTSAANPIPGQPDRLTEHPGEDRHPAVVRDGTDLWLFWDSDRRGPRDLWHRRRTGVTWGEPVRIEKTDPGHDGLHDTFPAALVVGSDVWLFWCRDMGDRREIWHQVVSGGVFGPQVSLSSPSSPPGSPSLPTGGRDEAPSPVIVGGRVWLFFHSNRLGPWQIWVLVHDGTNWPVSPTRLSAEVTADKEPTGYVDGSDLHVFWTSQRRVPWYRSRTLDLDDPLMVGEMGTFNDHAHYVYDTGKQPDDWYARETVGFMVQPDVADTNEIAAGVQRTTSFLEPFRPAPVRYVWPLEPEAAEEPLEDDALVHEEWVDDVS
jgi:hypothetical protein